MNRTAVAAVGAYAKHGAAAAEAHERVLVLERGRR